jgi:tetratricopeptide (TPR) repeat protein
MFQEITKKNSAAALITTGTVMIFLLLSLVGVSLAGESLAESDKTELYSQGLDFFHQATEISASKPEIAKDLYAKSLLRFNLLVEEGDVRNGKLFYNIGNINFLLEDIGRAILNYRRAEQFIPNDPNLVKNLAYARNMRQDKLGIKDQKKIKQTLFFFHYDFGTKTRLILFGISYVLFWIFAGLKIFSKRPYTSWVLTISLFFFLLFGTSLYVEHHQSAASFEGVILAPEVIARQGDAESYQPSFEDPLHTGTEFILLEDRDAWWQIELPDGRNCWVSSRSGALVKIFP